MKLKGVYTVHIKQRGEISRTYTAENLITNKGLERVVDWLISDSYSSSSYYGIKEIDIAGATASDDGSGSNPQNSIDGSDSSFYTQTANSTVWGNRWLQVDFVSPVNLSAVYIDWYEDDQNQNNQYRFEVEYADNIDTWVVLPDVYPALSNEGSRTKTLQYLRPFPEFAPFENVNAFRIGMKYNSGNDNVYIYEMKFFGPSDLPQAPAVMALGTSTTAASTSDTALGAESLRKTISNSANPSGYIARSIMSLDLAEGNDTTFGEVGLFYAAPSGLVSPSGFYWGEKQTTDNANELFSRAVFSPTWSKTNVETADIFYEITVADNTP
jgi:hypothetical protein